MPWERIARPSRFAGAGSPGAGDCVLAAARLRVPRVQDLNCAQAGAPRSFGKGRPGTIHASGPGKTQSTRRAIVDRPGTRGAAPVRGVQAPWEDGVRVDVSYGISRACTSA